MTGDNATSTKAVASCGYRNQWGPKNNFLTVNNNSFAIFDNFEWTGMCQNIVQNAGNNYGFGQNNYIADNGGGTVQVQNVYETYSPMVSPFVPYSCSDNGEPVWDLLQRDSLLR